MNRSLTFLQLTAEFGGTKFGPFPGPEIRLGSDPSRNDITLPESLGVLAEHVKILVQTDGSYIVAPTERTAAVHVFRGSQRPRHIAAATALTVGDAFALVTADGPRFVLIAEEPPRPEKKKQSQLGKMVPTREGLWTELRRVGFALFFRNRIGNTIQRVWMLVKTGTIFTPRYIIAFLMMGTGAFAFLAAAIGGLFAKFRIDKLNGNVQDCQDELAHYQAQSETENQTIESLLPRILGDSKWGYSYENAPAEFREELNDTLRSTFADTAYRELYTRESGPFFELSSQLRRKFEDGQGKALAIVLPFLNVHPDYPSTPILLFRVAETSRQEEQCVRGPARLTTQQAVNLGLQPVVPTALGRGEELATKTPDDLRALLYSVPGTSVDARTLYAESELDQLPIGDQADGFACLTVRDAEDQRDDPSAIARALETTIGPTARGLPAPTDNWWILARIIKFYAADVPSSSFQRLQFDDLRRGPTASMEAQGDAWNDEITSWILKKSAQAVGKAAAIRCQAFLDRESRAAATEILVDLDTPGREFDCLYLSYLSQQQP